MSNMDSSQIAAFEIFRNSLNNVLILTFDELYQRIVDLISILSAEDTQMPAGLSYEPAEKDLEEIPF